MSESSKHQLDAIIVNIVIIRHYGILLYSRDKFYGCDITYGVYTVTLIIAEAALGPRVFAYDSSMLISSSGAFSGGRASGKL